MEQYIAYIDQGDPRELASALVEGRLEQLQQRRDMINFVRQFVGLPPRRLSPAKQIADVTRQLTALYEQATTMIGAKNTLADALIDQATKSGKLKLEKATHAAKLAEQERIKAEEEKKTREAQAAAAISPEISPEADQRAEELARREHERQLLEKEEEIARINKSIRELNGSDGAVASPFKRAAEAILRQLPSIAKGSLFRKKLLKTVDALHTADSLAGLQEMLGEDFVAVRQTLKDCGIRVD
ncbi:MAG: hypothetical protein ACHQ9S_19355 [Candidatus Binatia bacterium]